MHQLVSDVYQLLINKLQTLTLYIEKALNVIFTQKYNPFYYHGALPNFFLWVLLLSGLILFAYYNASAAGAYYSIQYMMEGNPAGALFRAIHRYAADGMMIFVLLHFIRVWWTDRYREYRILPWITGVILLIVVFIAGLTGYMLIWDDQALALLNVTRNMLVAVPLIGAGMDSLLIGGTVPNDYTVTRIMFLHFAVPALMMFLLWWHYLRITRPVTTAPFTLNVIMFGGLLVACGTMTDLLQMGNPVNDYNNIEGTLLVDWLFMLPQAMVVNWYNQCMLEHFNTPWLMITGGDVVLPDGEVLEGGTVLINQGKIQDIVDKPPASLLLEHGDVSVVEAHGQWVTPGLIDQHMHGAFGVDFNHAGIGPIHEMLSELPRHGVTAVVPTLMTAPKLDMVSALSTLEEVIHSLSPTESRVLGLHLEGPFLNPQYRGAHPKEHLLTPHPDQLEGLLSPNLKRLTLAPELDEGFQTIQSLINQQVQVALGHSEADFMTTVEAARAGANCIVHLFNAMGPIHHREPGIAIASLIHDDLFTEFIADGKHLSPVTIQLIMKTKPFDKAILISDCNALTGLQPGTVMDFGGQQVTIGDDGPLNEEGRLAGSNVLISDAVRNLVQWGILSFPRAIQLATSHPATYLGETSLIGQIAPKTMADLVLWDKETLSISSVFLAGQSLPLMSSNPSPS